jgi:hypothetical protein
MLRSSHLQSRAQVHPLTVVLKQNGRFTQI